MARTKSKAPQIDGTSFPATAVITATSSSGSSTRTAVTGSYTFVAGQKYQMSIQSSNANSASVWQFSYSVSGGGTQTGPDHGRFGGSGSVQAMFNMTNIFVPTSSGSQTVTVTATVVSAGTSSWDDAYMIIIPLLN